MRGAEGFGGAGGGEAPHVAWRSKVALQIIIAI